MDFLNRLRKIVDEDKKQIDEYVPEDGNIDLVSRLREFVDDGKNQINELVEEEGKLIFVNRLNDTEIRALAEEIVDDTVTNIDKEIVGNLIYLTIENNDKTHLILDDYYVYRNKEVDKDLTKKLRDYLTEKFDAEYYKKVMCRK